jgi:hypothetical protein
MQALVRLVPGLIAAVAAFVALQLIGLVGLSSLAWQAVTFLGVYLVVHVAVDQAMAAYGTGGP